MYFPKSSRFLLIFIIMSLGIASTFAHEDENCPHDVFLHVEEGSALILEVTCTDEHMMVSSNNMPMYETEDFPHGTLTAMPRTWYIPLEPQLADEPTALPLMGAVGLIINGIQIQGPNAADRDGYFDPVTNNMLDFCNAHIAGQGEYHYHARANCLLDELTENPDDPTQLVGVILGYGFDGFPILTPYICTNADCSEVTEVQSSWQLTNPSAINAWEENEFVEGSGDLDQCNGMVQADGSYAYYATDTFPYFMGCYMGEVEELNFDPEATRWQGEAQVGMPQGGQQGQPPQGGQGQQPPPPGGQGGQQPPPPPGGGN